MKKISSIVLLFILVLCFSACSGKSTDNTTDKNTDNIVSQNSTEVIMTFPNKTTTEKQIFEDSVYEKVYFEMLGTKVNADIDQELNDQLEKAKTIKEPILDDSMKEIGSVWVQYKNSDELVEFGKVYTGAENKMFIQAFENEHNGVLCISEGNENTSNILF